MSMAPSMRILPGSVAVVRIDDAHCSSLALVLITLPDVCDLLSGYPPLPKSYLHYTHSSSVRESSFLYSAHPLHVAPSAISPYPLIWACQGGHSDVFKILVASGAIINAEDNVSGWIDGRADG